MNCPACKTVALSMSDRQGIEIDYCPQCRGVWLDRGELDKIIERTAQDVPAEVPRTQERPRYDENTRRYEENGRRYGKNKRRGFLSDIFDFD